MKIEILGTGCPKCKALTAAAQAAAEELALDYTLTKVTDLQEIIAHGVMMTPALVADGQLLLSGRVPTVAEIKGLLAKAV
ncbi:MAG TPA: thioredoxin family protein [bacterium]